MFWAGLEMGCSGHEMLRHALLSMDYGLFMGLGWAWACLGMHICAKKALSRHAVTKRNTEIGLMRIQLSKIVFDSNSIVCWNKYVCFHWYE
jgi:hypothetical protein